MNCNNKFCTWCMFDTCCHESEEGHEKATPNKLDCPSSLRSDFEEEFLKMYDITKARLSTFDLELKDNVNFEKLRAIKKVLDNTKSTHMFI